MADLKCGHTSFVEGCFDCAHAVMRPRLEKNTVYRVVVDPVSHFYVAVPDEETSKETGIAEIETYSYKRAFMYAPNSGENHIKVISYDEYQKLVKEG